MVEIEYQFSPSPPTSSRAVYMNFQNSIQVESKVNLSQSKGNAQNHIREKEDAPIIALYFVSCLISLRGWADWLKLELLVE